MSLASRRNRRDYSNPDDAKSSIVGLSGWLFADLLLALAVVFLVASDRPSQSLAENPEDKFDIDVEFVESELADAKAVTQIERIDENFDLWIRFSEPVYSDSFTEADLLLEPNNEWSFRFVDKLNDGTEKLFRIRLNPEKVTDTKLSLTIAKRAVRGSKSDNSYNSKATLTISVTICQSLGGIEVNKKETARFQIRGGERMDAKQLVEWFKSGKRTDSPRSAEDAGYGDALLISKAMAEGSQVGFVILFGGYDSKNSEKVGKGQSRAENKQKEVLKALRELGLIPKLKNLGGSQCPLPQEIPTRPFGAGIPIDDLKFEMYFYEKE